MRGIILYKSKYGSTEKYAKWLAEDTGFDIKEISKAKLENVMEYNIIVIGGGIYASGVAGLSFLRKNIDSLSNKKIIVFCDGASPYDEKAFAEIKSYNMKDKLSKIPFFYCRGGWDMETMTFVDRNLCKMLRKVVSKKDPSEYEVWEQALMAAGEEKCDWTNRKYLEPIINEINETIVHAL